jgi:predicted metal-dependent hydrolase
VTALPFAVQVNRSARRRKTVGAQMKGGVLVVTVPAWMSKADEERWAAEMARRFARKHTAAAIDLVDRAGALARRHDLPEPTSITWAEMTSRWGSCTPAAGSIRISTAVARFPPWVLDYVLVHELAHLRVADHSPAFWALVERYPRAERARGFLIAKAGDGDEILC